MSDESFAPIASALKEINSTLKELARRLRQLESVERPAGLTCRWRGSAAAAPASPQDGDAYYSTVTLNVYIYADGAWRQIT